MSGHYSGHTAQDHRELVRAGIDPAAVEYVAEPQRCCATLCGRYTLHLGQHCGEHYRRPPIIDAAGRMAR